MNPTTLFTLATATTTTTTGTQADMMGTTIYMIVSLAAVVLVFYFFALKPQKKKEKEQKQMREQLQIGDEVTTIGGITGIVIRKTEDTVVIETGANRNNIRVKMWAISENSTVHDAVEEGIKTKKKAPALGEEKKD